MSVFSVLGHIFWTVWRKAHLICLAMGSNDAISARQAQQWQRYSSFKVPASSTHGIPTMVRIVFPSSQDLDQPRWVQICMANQDLPILFSPPFPAPPWSQALLETISFSVSLTGPG